MCKLTFSHVTNGIKHDKVCWLPTCLHLLYPDTPQPQKAALGNLSRVCPSLCCSRKHQLQKKMLKALVVDNKKEKCLSGALRSGSDQDKGRSEGEENGVSILSGCPELGVCLPQVLGKCPLCSCGLLSVKSPSVPFFSFRNPHFFQRMTMSITQNNDARWQKPHSHQIDRLTNDLDNVFTVHAFNR